MTTPTHRQGALLENRVGLVSGVGPGIGRSLALALAREGADVALVARNEATLHGIAAEIEALGRRAVPVRADITRPGDCRRVAEATHSAFGRIDILVNNAFVSQPRVRFMEGDLRAWRQTMDVNFWGSMEMTHAVVPFMRELGDARVIMIGSGSALVAAEGFGAYSGSKGALLSATRVLAKELGAWGIRVNTLIPGSTDTQNTRDYHEKAAKDRGVDVEVVRAEFTDMTALGYLPSPDEVADAAVFFASPLARAVTGQYLHVNGGSQLA